MAHVSFRTNIVSAIISARSRRLRKRPLIRQCHRHDERQSDRAQSCKSLAASGLRESRSGHQLLLFQPQNGLFCKLV